MLFMRNISGDFMFEAGIEWTMVKCEHPHFINRISAMSTRMQRIITRSHRFENFHEAAFMLIYNHAYQ